MANVTLKGEAIHALDALCRSHVTHGRRVSRLAPTSPHDCSAFQAVLRGEHLVRGFRNCDLAAVLQGRSPRGPDERRKRSARLGRFIASLRGHGLVAKVPRSHRYRITPRGQRLMSAAIRVRTGEFPQALAAA